MVTLVRVRPAAARAAVFSATEQRSVHRRRRLQNGFSMLQPETGALYRLVVLTRSFL